MTFEKFLEEKFIKIFPDVLDDEMADSFDEWLGTFDVDNWLKYGEMYGQRLAND